jgi:hypothetical protein
VRNLKTRIAAGATVIGLGGLTGLALSAGQQKAAPAATKPLVRTKVVHRTIHVTKHVKPKHPAAGAGPGAAGTLAYTGSGGSGGSATTGASSTGSSSTYSSSAPVTTGSSGAAGAPTSGSAPVTTHTSGSAAGGGGGGAPVTTHTSGSAAGGGSPVTTASSGGGGGEHDSEHGD